MKFNCECCNYSTDDKSNFNKHIISKKHKLVESKVVVTSKTTQSQHLVIPESTSTVINNPIPVAVVDPIPNLETPTTSRFS